MVRDGSLSGLRTTFRRIAITAATAARVAAAPPVFAAAPAFTSFPILTPNAGSVLDRARSRWHDVVHRCRRQIVGRIDQHGSVTEFGLHPVPRASGITARPDGALSVTLQGSEAIGRLTPRASS